MSSEDFDIILTQLGERARKLSEVCRLARIHFQGAELETMLGEVRIWEELLVESQRVKEAHIQSYFEAHFGEVEKISQRKVFKCDKP